MLETNARIVYPGSKLYVTVKKASVVGSDISPDLLQRACGRLRTQHGLAAVPLPSSESGLLVLTRNPIPIDALKNEKWELNIQDAGESAFELRGIDAVSRDRIATLIERALTIQVQRNTKLWRVTSWRTWYEPKPFTEREGVSAFQRYDLSTSWVDDEGIAVSVGVGTAFFTSENLAYFFDPDLAAGERNQRREMFDRLTQRQHQRKKGTLLYKNGKTITKCYFVDAPEGMTCGTTGLIRIANKSYGSLLEYYRAVYPNLKVDDSDVVVQVSFPGLDGGVYAAAKLLVARIMNDNVPERLKSVDKLPPDMRRNKVENFWQQVGSQPFGRGVPSPVAGLWRPKSEKVHQLKMPDLMFGKGACLVAPTEAGSNFSENYRKRLSMLEEHGCYHVPPTMERTIYYALPNSVSQKARQQLIDDLTKKISGLAKGPVLSAVPILYNSISDAFSQLRKYQAGAVVFVLNDEPNAYHEVAFQLDGWRVKRITSRVLSSKYQEMQTGNDQRNGNGRSDPKKGRNRWKDFIVENALDVLQLLDVIPYRVAQLGPYEAMLVIDVGEERRYQAVSLLVMRNQGLIPECVIVRHVVPKPDINSEAINPVILGDLMLEIVNRGIRSTRYPLQSILILRDGKTVDREPEGYADGITKIKAAKKLTENARVDIVDVHKDTLRHLRFWDVAETNAVNSLEGTVLELDSDTVLLTTTGISTLHQGTANPLLIVGNGRCSNILDAAQAIFAACQLNWSSPKMAQRLPLPLKVTDEELAARLAQEIRRIR